MRAEDMKCPVHFRHVFRMLWRWVLASFEVFRVAFWRFLRPKTRSGRKTGKLWESTFYLHYIDVFQGCRPHLGCQKETKNRVGIRSGFTLGFLVKLGCLWESFLEPKSVRGVLWGDKIVQQSCLDMELGLRLPTNRLPGSFGHDLVHDAGNSKGDLFIYIYILSMDIGDI